MSILALIPLLLALSGGPSSLAGAWILVNNVEWQSPPVALHKTYVEGDGEILVFFHSGEFGYLSTALFKDRSSGTVSVCAGCSFSTKRGSWRLRGENLVVSARWVHQDLRPLPSTSSATTDYTTTVWRITARAPDGSPEELQRGVRRYNLLGQIANPEVITSLLGSE